MKKYQFDIFGSDERQFSSQGFKINMASITKDKYYEYPYYHSSLDNLDFVKPESIIESLSLHKDVLEKINTEVIYQTRHRECEVMLSKHDLYPKTGAAQIPTQNHLSDLDLTLWILWLCDGQLGLYGIAKKLGVPLERITKIIGTLESRQLIERIS